MTGLTLLEIVTAIAIIAILLAIAEPSYQYITNTNRVASEVNGLLGDLQFARAEAIKEGQTVSVCVSSDGASCLAASTSWQNGWMVFSDPNNLGATATNNVGYTVLRVQKTFTGTDTFTASNAVGAILFNREGFAPGMANGTLVSLHVANDTANKWTRCLSITLAGLTTVQIFGTTTNGFTCT